MTRRIYYLCGTLWRGISAEVVKKKAGEEYAKFHQRTMYELSPVELHFIENFEKEQKLLKSIK